MSNFKVLIGVMVILSNWRDISSKDSEVCWTKQAFLSNLYSGDEPMVFYRVPQHSLEDCKNSCSLFSGCKILYYDQGRKLCFKNLGPIDPFNIRLKPGGTFEVYLQHLCDDPEINNRYISRFDF